MLLHSEVMEDGKGKPGGGENGSAPGTNWK